MFHLSSERRLAGLRRAGKIFAMVCAVAFASTPTQGQNLTALTNFNGDFNYTGYNSVAPLIQGPDGTLYGTAINGGEGQSGAIFATQPDGSDFRLLYSFSGGTGGFGPAGGLLLVGGTLYGTTSGGGAGENGIVYSVDTNGGNFTILHDFTGTLADRDSTATLALVGDTLFGTAAYGGPNNYGSVFAVGTNGSNFRDLYSFKGGLDCGIPNAGLTVVDGVLYGTTSGESSLIADFGSVFKINPDGSGFAVLKTFKSGDGTGANPAGGLVESGGELYGTASSGTPGYGTVFRLNTNGGAFTVLYKFTGGADGSSPYNTLVLSGASVYGTTTGGGPDGQGVIFRVGTSGGFANLHSFTGGDDGGDPSGGLMLAADGLLYGATYQGGTNAVGVLFKIGVNGTGFAMQDDFEGNVGPSNPTGALALSGAALYGMTTGGGVSGRGTIFTVNTNGSGLTTLRSFSGADGNVPAGGLVQSNGILYGVTSEGGTNDYGSVFALDASSGAFTNLHTFKGTDGQAPTGGVVLSGGVLYGTTTDGGANGYGAVFQIGVDGSGFKTLWSFTGTDGQNPIGQLTLANGRLYGVTSFGGSAGEGVIFSLNLAGTAFAVLHSFSATVPPDATNLDGAKPTGAFIAQGGFFYGTTSLGGADGQGTIFKISPTGVFTVLSSPEVALNPVLGGGLATGNDGNLYGETASGGTNGSATIFQLTTNGVVTTLASFAPSLEYSLNTLTPAGDGTFFGAANVGGQFGTGLVFRLNPLLPVAALESSGATALAGTNVTITSSDAGQPPLFYQWSFNGSALSGETNASLTLGNVSPSESGAYTLLISNMLGSALTGAFTLQVIPAVATSFLPTAIGETNATLNGSVTFAEAGTVGWFDWGKTSSYGAVAGLTTLPGASGTVVLSNVLTGLAGGEDYHYRMAASNSFGVVYGSDEVIVPGFAPTIVSGVAIDLATTNATLTGLVDPNTLSTSAYFRWGSNQFNLNNFTSTTNLGSAHHPVAISAPISGLVAGKAYYFEIVADNQIGETTGPLIFFSTGPWTQTAAPLHNWDSIAASADGSVLVAVAYDNGVGGPIYTSTNYGVTWISNTAPIGRWQSVACSADGSEMVVAGGGGGDYPGQIYLSTNSGATWGPTRAPSNNWYAVAASGDGTKLVAVDAIGERIYRSVDSGSTWTKTSAPSNYWFSIASSADGTNLVAVSGNYEYLGHPPGPIYTSTNGGATWISNSAPKEYWSHVSSSANGATIVAVAGGNSVLGLLYTSTNLGGTWTPRPSLGLKEWIYCACSADGTKMAAAALNAPIYTSTNSGVSWITNSVPILDWNAVAFSADGAFLLASVGYPATGGIYSYASTPEPILGLTPSTSNPTLSWTIPSANFTLQETSNLAAPNWTDVTNQPGFNFTTLHNELVIPLDGAGRFYRLKSQ